MTPHLKSAPPNSPSNLQPHQRPAWRQRLVDTERGFTQGMRLDSTMFVHFFIACIVLATALVLGLGALHWAVLVMALTSVIAAEMFNQILKALLREKDAPPSSPLQKALRIGTAAVFVTIIGATVSIGLIFAQRFNHLLGE